MPPMRMPRSRRRRQRRQRSAAPAFTTAPSSPPAPPASEAPPPALPYLKAVSQYQRSAIERGLRVELQQRSYIVQRYRNQIRKQRSRGDAGPGGHPASASASVSYCHWPLDTESYQCRDFPYLGAVSKPYQSESSGNNKTDTGYPSPSHCARQQPPPPAFYRSSHVMRA